MARILSNLPGIAQFQSGVGDGDQLLVRLQESPEGGWFPALRPGFYYLGTEERYLYAARGQTTTTFSVTGVLTGLAVSSLLVDPTRLGPVRLLAAGNPRPLQRVASPLRVYRSVTTTGSGTVRTIQLPASGYLVSLVSDPVTGILLSVPATGDIIGTDEYVYERASGLVFLRDPDPPHLYATLLVDESCAVGNPLRQEELLAVSRDGRVRTQFSPILCAGSGSVLRPVVKRPTAGGWFFALGENASGNVLTLAGSGAYTSLVQRDRPLLWWRMNEVSGTVLTDSASGRYPAVLSGAITFGAVPAITSEGGTATTWDGGAAQGNSSGSVSLPATLSLELWVKLGFSATQRAFLSNRTALGASGFYFGTYYGAAWFNDANASANQGLIGTRWLADNRWHHVVLAADGQVTRLYVDGLEDGWISQPRVAFTNRIAIATDTDGSHFPGGLDDVAVYNYALSAEQVLDHYEAGAALAGGIASGDLVACRYYVQDSFTATPSGGGRQLAIGLLPVVSASGDNYTVEYETGSDWYYNSLEASGSAMSIQLNPLLTPRDSGFLYWCDQEEGWPTPARLRLDVSNRNPLYSPSGSAPVVFAIAALDAEGEPIPEIFLTVTAVGASGAFVIQYPNSPKTDGRGQLRYTWSPQGSGIVTFTAQVSGGGASGQLVVQVRDVRHYVSQAEYQLGKLTLALEETPYRGTLRRLLAYYSYMDGAPFQPHQATDRWQTAVTFRAARSAFFTLDGLPLPQPASLVTDADGVAQVLVDASPGDVLRAEVQSSTPGRKRVAAPILVPVAVGETA